MPKTFVIAVVPIWPAVATPKGFKLSSRGQGHSFGARRPAAHSPCPVLSGRLSLRAAGRPRTAPLGLTDPEGVEPFGRSRAEQAFDASLPWVSSPDYGTTHVNPLRGAQNGQTSSSRTGRSSLLNVIRIKADGQPPALPVLVHNKKISKQSILIGRRIFFGVKFLQEFSGVDQLT